MAKEPRQATGTTNYKDGILTITTNAVRGKKTVPLTRLYMVVDLRPDRRVANPAYRLTKVELVGEDELQEAGFLPVSGKVYRPTGEAYDVAIERYGPTCSCAHAIYRGGNSRIPCKHALALQAVGLIPRNR